MEECSVLSKEAKINILKSINLDKEFMHKLIATKNGSFICYTVEKNKSDQKKE